MKHLFFMRHSKAAPAGVGAATDDHSRELTEKGEAITFLAAEYMQAKPALQHIYSSDAARTAQTAQLLAEQLQLDEAHISYTHDLYLATSQEILHYIHRMDEAHDAVMLVGHNPGIHDCLLRLIGEGNKREYKLLRASYPPASITHITFSTEYWAEILEQSGSFVDFFTYKRL